MRLPRRPTIYEINTAVWLERLGRARGRPLGLGEVPAAEWDALAALPVDAVWLMGVWERSPAGLRIALAGRSRPKLDAVAAELGGAAGSWPRLIVDVTDPAACADVANSTRVLVTTVGPYARYGYELVKACAVAGALVAGGYFGYALSWVGMSEAELASQRLVRALLGGLAGTALVVGSLLLERACRVSKGDS